MTRGYLARWPTQKNPPLNHPPWPHPPWHPAAAEDQSLKMSHGSVCLPTASGRKDDLAVILPELARTGSLLKQLLGCEISRRGGVFLTGFLD